MRKEGLTDLAIQNLKTDASARFEVFDTKLPGFGVRVFPSGIKSFILFYRHQGRLRRLTLGRYPVVSLADARRMAFEALGRVTRGSDPQREKQDERRKLNFEDAVARFVTEHCERHNRAATAHETARVLRTRFIPRFAKRDLKEITRADIARVLDGIVSEGKGSTANHTLAAIRKLFNWCVDRGLMEVSPCVGIKIPAPLQSRDRVLVDTELAAVWRASDVVGFPFGTIVKLLILTGQRRGEVAAMRWDEIDFESGAWSIPAQRTKSNKAQVVPLPPQAISLLRSAPRFESPFVFMALGNEDASFSGFSKAKARLAGLAEFGDWTLHDLRRTAASGLARLGVSPHVIERILDHTTGTLGGVAGIYNRFGYLPEMREALERWSDYVSKLVDQGA